MKIRYLIPALAVLMAPTLPAQAQMGMEAFNPMTMMGPMMAPMGTMMNPMGMMQPMMAPMGAMMNPMQMMGPMMAPMGTMMNPMQMMPGR